MIVPARVKSHPLDRLPSSPSDLGLNRPRPRDGSRRRGLRNGRGRRPGQPTDGSGVFGGTAEADEPVAESVPFVPKGETPLQLFEIERASAYFVTGGLVAVHSTARDRRSIWDAPVNGTCRFA